MKLGKQFLVFLGVGLTCAIIDITTMQTLMYFGVFYMAAVSAGFIVGLVANYAFHTKITFKSATSYTTATKFCSVVLVNYLITMGMVIITQELLGNALIGKIVSLPVIAVNGFFLSRYWVFR